MTTSDPNHGTVDLRRFSQVFFEECAEHLADLEQILISLADRQPDEEQLNAIFRAAHSIKGGAGIFGFEEMTVVTHVMESLLDRLRRNEIAFGSEMIDLFLEAGDVISMQLAGYRDGTAVRQEAVEAVTAKLQRLIDSGSSQEPSDLPAPPSPHEKVSSPEVLADPDGADSEGRRGQAPAEPVPAPAPALRRYEVLFSPAPDIFKRGVRVEALLAELKDLAEPGEFQCRAELGDVPDFADFDPESCITKWRLHLGTRSDAEAITEVFLFAAEEEELEIRELPPESDGGRPPRETPPPAPEVLTGQPGCDAGRSAPLPAPESHAPSAETPTRADNPGRRAYDREQAAAGSFGRRQGESDSSIRVSVAKVDQLINQMGEMLITQAMLLQSAGDLDPVRHQALHQTLAQLERNSRELQGSIMSIRLVPVGMVFNRFPRLVRELAGRLGKAVVLKTVGETTELDKGLIEKIADPLAHLVRNSLDHGIETSEARVAAGKPPAGSIELKAFQAGGRIVIEVSDDGAGLDRERILAKARERGIACSGAMSDEEVWQLIFAPGFSTAETVTDISGRGVGMDVVLKNVQAIGGRVQVTSQTGLGACISISLPLTLAILNGLSVAVGGEKFIIPLASMIESLQPKPEQLQTMNGRELVGIRGDYLPILRLCELFGIREGVRDPRRGILVLVDLEGTRAALLVDALLDEQQVVVKSLEANYRKVEGSSGATILGDGRVALILDVMELLAMQKRLEKRQTDKAKEAA